MEEAVWLRHHIGRLRFALRYTKSRQTEAVLQEVISEAETRLELLEKRQASTAK